MNYRVEWMPIVLPWAALVLLLIPPVAVLAVVVIALAAVGAAVALAGAVLALPYLLARSLHRRWRARRGAMQAQVLGNVASHPHAKIVGRHLSTPDEELSILHAPHPFAASSEPLVHTQTAEPAAPELPVNDAKESRARAR